jgi:hypothetical protein
VFAALLWTSAVASAAEPASRPGASRPFQILAWGGPPTDEQAYRDLVSAGFTHNFSPAADSEEVAKQLDLAAKTGLKLVITSPELWTSPEAVAKRFRDHPALAYYYLTDEPSAVLFDQLGDIVRRLQKADPAHPAYINLLPTYASAKQLGTETYRDHLDQYIEKIPTPQISFDHYPITFGELPGAGFYDNLEQVTAAGKRSGRPIWAFVMSVGIEGWFPVATLTGMRYQAFSNLAYGVQSIQFFTYWTPNPTHEKFHDAPYTINGKRTPVYDRVKQMTAEIHALSGVFQGARVVALGHTGQTLPLGTRRYEAQGPIRSVETPGSGALVSLLAKGNRRSLAIVSRDVKGKTPVKAEIDPGVTMTTLDATGTSRPVEGASFETTLEPAGIVVLTWEEKAKP